MPLCVVETYFGYMTLSSASIVIINVVVVVDYAVAGSR